MMRWNIKYDDRLILSGFAAASREGAIHHGRRRAAKLLGVNIKRIKPSDVKVTLA